MKILISALWFQVGDLGLSKVKCQTLISGGVRGTLPWMAPELLNGSSSLVSEKVQASIHSLIFFSISLVKLYFREFIVMLGFPHLGRRFTFQNLL